LVAEIIVVEWNPPGDRPPLAQAIVLPKDPGTVTVRFIQVPPDLHQQFRHAEALPLFQMIAKNVGMRRARGRFLLCTNIDIIFSNELMEYIASGRLQAGIMYRVDRFDVQPDVPEMAPLEVHLQHCQTKMIRVNRRAGTYPVTPTGGLLPFPDDISAESSGIIPGDGWHVPEGQTGGRWRWASSRVEIQFTQDKPQSEILTLDLEVNPWRLDHAIDLAVQDDEGHTLFEGMIKGRQNLNVALSPSRPPPKRLWLIVMKQHGDALEGFPINERRSDICYRALGITWLQQQQQLPVPSVSVSAPPITTTLMRSIKSQVRKIARILLDRVLLGKWRIREIIAESNPPAQDTRPVLEDTGYPLMDLERFLKRVRPEYLHSNACGDFQLMSREDWFDLRGYPEFHVFSMNIDSVLGYTAQHKGIREEMLAPPLCIYHLEHSLASGWSPEGGNQLYEKIIRKGIPWLDFTTVCSWASYMRFFQSPMIFNSEGWGLAEQTLPETGC
jgi:hypothetical protein